MEAVLVMGSGVVVWIRGAWGRKGPFLLVGCWRAHGDDSKEAQRLPPGFLNCCYANSALQCTFNILSEETESCKSP